MRGSEVRHACDACGQRNRIPPRHLAARGRCGACGEIFGPLAEPLSVGSAAFEAVVAGARVPVLVDFWADWCAPCRTATPHLEEAARATAGAAVVLKVDTEANPSLAARYHVQGIPFFLVLRGGEVVRQQAGLVDSQTMKGWLRAAA